MKTKTEKSWLVVFLLLMLLTQSLFSAEDSLRTVNGKLYHRLMFNAVVPEKYINIPFGSENNHIGGGVQDIASAHGLILPATIRFADDGQVWVLDSVNKALKLFDAEGRVQKLIKTDKLGKKLNDFVISARGSIAFLDTTDGYVVFTDLEGNRVNEIEGLVNARKIEFSQSGDLYVDFPVMQAVLRFSSDGELVEQNVCDESLSLYESPAGQLYGLEICALNARLYVRTVASPPEIKTLVELPGDWKVNDVNYLNGSVIGTDNAGNVYFKLLACDKSGTIYRERLYRATSAGKINGELDILAPPVPDQEFARQLVVSPDGKIAGFYGEGDQFIVYVLSITDKEP